MNYQRLPPAIHFSVYLRITKPAFNRHRHTQADVPIAGTGVYIGLKVAWQRHIYASISRMDIPRRVHSRAVAHSRLHAAVPGPDVQAVEPPLKLDVPVPGVGGHFAIKPMRFDAAIPGSHLDLALESVHADASITGMQINGAGQLIGLHGAVARRDRYVPLYRGSLYRAISRRNLQIARFRHAYF